MSSGGCDWLSQRLGVGHTGASGYEQRALSQEDFSWCFWKQILPHGLFPVVKGMVVLSEI